MRRLAALAVPALVALPLATTFAAPAAGQGFPLSPSAEESREAWVNPAVRADERETDLLVDTVSAPRAVAAGADSEITVQLRNATDHELGPVSLTPLRAGAVGDVAEARTALVQDRSAYAPAGPAEPAADLGPGETREVTVTLPGTASGVYPVAVEVRAGEEVTSERMLVAVGDAAGAAGEGTGGTDAGAGAETTAAGEETDDERAPATVLVRVTAQVDTVPGETGEAPETAPLILRDESLAEAMAPGGRLDGLLSAVEARRGALGEGLCLAIDPALVDAAERMTHGYTIAETRRSQATQQRRLRDSWSLDDDSTGEPGRGTEDAAAFLERLRALAQGCTVAMPWADTDLDAVARTGDPWLMREALQRGPDILRSVLGAEPLEDVVLPGAGYVEPATAPALAWADTAEGSAAAIEPAWESSDAPKSDASGRSTLDDPGLPAAGSGLPGPPDQTVSVLVADNTVWSAPRAGHFAELAPGIRAVTHQSSLTATLASVSEQPVTAGYANPDTRMDYRLDSPVARETTAAGAVDLALRGEDPVLVTVPGHADGESAGAIIDAAVAAAGGTVTLADYLTVDRATGADLAAASEAATSAGADAGEGFGAPFTDPGVYSDAEVLRATQQATYTDDLTRIMANDPSIALTRYGFTAPLRRDILTALTVAKRRSIAGFDDAVDATAERLGGNRVMLQDLRSSVELMPPGNVYTRSSESSPLIIVARNGLPLPTRTRIDYVAEGDATLNTPDEVRIPARGSLTVSMTADIPDNDRRTDLELWLATPDGAAISNRVDITVQTRARLIGATVAGVTLVGGLALAALFRAGRRHRRRVRATGAQARRRKLKRSGR
ncbi:hypothetical protein [Corynebacterium frankenforstense]